MIRLSILEGSDGDRPGLAAGMMLAALVVLGFQDSLVRLAGPDTSLWQFQLLRSTGNVLLLLLVARLVWGTPPKRPKRFWAILTTPSSPTATSLSWSTKPRALRTNPAIR